MTDPPIEHGFVCGSCGLSDHGYARFRKHRFNPYPCVKCRDHFEPVLGPPYDPPMDPDATPPDEAEDGEDACLPLW